MKNFKPSRRSNDPDSNLTQIDLACELLDLAACLHIARGDPQIWHDALSTFRDLTLCQGELSQIPEPTTLTPDVLASLAGQLSHCANFGDDCPHQMDVKRQHCAAFAVHMHTAAVAVHHARKAALFDDLPATWLLDRNAHVYEANAKAKAIVESGESVTIEDKQLALIGPGGRRIMLSALAKVTVTAPARMPWKDTKGRAVSFLLRSQPGSNFVTMTALLDAPSAAERAKMLAKLLDLAPRQSELAALLLADHSLVGAARAMGITRHTANEHLTALEQRTRTADRKELLIVLRRISQM